jgi:hypothetical protein
MGAKDAPSHPREGTLTVSWSGPGAGSKDREICSRSDVRIRTCPGTAIAARVRRDVENDVVRMRTICCECGCWATHSHQPIQLEIVARSPCHKVIGTRRVAAHSEATLSHAIYIEREASTENIDPADALADHRILGRAETRTAGRSAPLAPGGVAVGDIGLDRIAGLQSI